MSEQDDNGITIEKTSTRVILTMNMVQFQMKPALARELGEALYKCGCDVEATQGQ